MINLPIQVTDDASVTCIYIIHVRTYTYRVDYTVFRIQIFILNFSLIWNVLDELSFYFHFTHLKRLDAIKMNYYMYIKNVSFRIENGQNSSWQRLMQSWCCWSRWVLTERNAWHGMAIEMNFKLNLMINVCIHCATADSFQFSRLRFKFDSLMSSNEQCFTVRFRTMKRLDVYIWISCDFHSMWKIRSITKTTQICSGMSNSLNILFGFIFLWFD